MSDEKIESIVEESSENTGVPQNNEDVGLITDVDGDTTSGETSPQGSSAPESSEASDSGAEHKEPEQYELAVSEDFPMPEENVKSFTAVCREAGMTKEQAEAVLGWHKEQYKGMLTYNEQQEKQVLAAWDKEISSDAEYGGKNYRQTVADARRALKTFDEDGALRQMLVATKYDRNPTIIRAIARIGRAMGEHGFVGQNGEGKADQRPLEDRMYPNMRV